MAAQIGGQVVMDSLDQPLSLEDGGMEVRFHDRLATKVQDPAQAAAREIDWGELLEEMNDRDMAVRMRAGGKDRSNRPGGTGRGWSRASKGARLRFRASGPPSAKPEPKIFL